jgi:hypothetical protein
MEEREMTEEQKESRAIREEQLEKFISIREQFEPLYRTTGLISVEGSLGILLRADMFAETFPNYESKPFDCDGSVCTEEIFAFFNGVRFFAIR